MHICLASREEKVSWMPHQSETGLKNKTASILSTRSPGRLGTLRGFQEGRGWNRITRCAPPLSLFSCPVLEQVSHRPELRAGLQATSFLGSSWTQYQIHGLLMCNQMRWSFLQRKPTGNDGEWNCRGQYPWHYSNNRLEGEKEALETSSSLGGALPKS